VNGMSDVHIVILAAGKGTRMKSALPKVLHRVAGRPMIEHVIGVANRLSPRSITVVIGHHADAVRGALTAVDQLTFVVQEPQLGTAHALLTTEALLRDRTGTLVLLSGDVPALSPNSLKRLVQVHADAHAAATVMTASLREPTGYGRIVRVGEKIAQIVEEKDATPDQRAITEINSGIYAFDLAGLYDSVRSIGTTNAQREYYLPDLFDIYRRSGRVVETVMIEDAAEIQGINSRIELADVGRHLRQRKNVELMAAGVTIEDPATTYIDLDVQVGPDTIIRPGVTLESGTSVGSGCVLHSGVRVAGSQVGDRAVVFDHSVVTDSVIGADSAVGPFAHLRGHAQIEPRAKVGNFVELKKTVLGEGSKAMHLAYLGDAVIGSEVNIGAGTITCNYDGVRKHVTTIAKGAFIGSDSQLIAPVTVGEGAYIGTGTTVREDVPPGSLAVSAGKQRNLEGWVERKRKRTE
jgi:bifunctional UDP-N-acetylglucosamine pyrophosphorylase/glucosamine-1-phosphate N-acetyltransferase